MKKKKISKKKIGKRRGLFPLIIIFLISFAVAAIWSSNYQDVGAMYLYDNFDDNSINTTKWTNTSSVALGSATTIEQNNKIEMDATQTDGGGATIIYTQIEADEEYVNYLRWTTSKAVIQTGAGKQNRIEIFVGTTRITDNGNNAETVYNDYSTGVWEINLSGTNHSLYKDGTYIRSFTGLSGNKFRAKVTVWDSSGAGVTSEHDFDNVYLNKESLAFYKNSPTNDTKTLNTYMNLNVTLAPQTSTIMNQTVIINNVTFIVHHDNGTLYNETTLSTETLSNTTQTINLTSMPDDTYLWNEWVWLTLGNTSRVFIADDEGNRSFSISPFIANSFTNNASSFETATETFYTNVTTRGLTPTSGKLIYNGTSYTATITNTNGNNYNLSATIDIPTTPETKPFYFNLTLGGVEYSTTEQNQIINATMFALCNATYTTPFLNLTFQDEGNQSNISASIPTSNFTYYLGSGDVVKSLIFSNNSENLNYTFCSSAVNRAIYVDSRVQYDSTSYPQRIWDEGVKEYNNVTNQTILYLLLTGVGQEVTIQVVNLAEQAVEGATVNVTRTIDGTETLIGIEETSAAGTVTFYLDPNFVHTFGVSATGYESSITSFAPTQTSYTVTLGSTSTTGNDYTRGISYRIGPRNDTLINDTSYNFQLNLTSSYWTVESFGFTLTNSSGYVFGSDSATSNGGNLSVSLDTKLNESITMNYYWEINNSFTNFSTTWMVLDSEGKGWSIKNFFDNLKTTISGGLFGIGSFGLSLIVFFAIFLTVGITSYRFGIVNRGSILLMVFALIFVFDVGLGMFDGLVGLVLDDPISGIITAIYGIVMAVILIRGGTSG